MQTNTPERALQFALEVGLLPNSVVCPSCGKNRTNHTSPNATTTTRRFECANGHPRVAIAMFDQTTLKGSKLQLAQIIKILHCFWLGNSIKVTQAETKCSKATVSEWYKKARTVCLLHSINNTVKIGGPGIVVEVDEMLMIKSKSFRGKEYTGYWMIGGAVKNQPDQFFFEMVDSRTQSSTKDVIMRHIEPGSIINTDGWSGYDWIGTDKSQTFTRQKVIHKHNEWVGPDGATTNHIEAKWRMVRHSIPEFGTPRWYHPHPIAEHEYKRSNVSFREFLHECGKVTGEMIDHMAQQLEAEKEETAKMLAINAEARALNAEKFQQQRENSEQYHKRRMKVIEGQRNKAEKKLTSAKSQKEKRDAKKKQNGKDRNEQIQESDIDEPVEKRKRTESTRERRKIHNPDFIYEKSEKRTRRKRTTSNNPSLTSLGQNGETELAFPRLEDPPIPAVKDTRSTINSDFHVLKERFPDNPIWDVQRDGNCWIWAILVQLVKNGGSEFSPKSRDDYLACMLQIRERTVGTLINQKDLFKDALADLGRQIEWDDFLERTRTSGKDGGPIELKALVMTLDLTITVKNARNRQRIIIGNGEIDVHVGYFGWMHYVAILDN
ncbi:putative transposase [Blattamonas nauphoetae]|uniref:Transposase n=1 Tax=Blattamonas nauphoetae TaxID=2049346 RepID=A0ABQ9YDU5_9EUKA|nr:putative transposase [Blattamonas nauphoetae]